MIHVRSFGDFRHLEDLSKRVREKKYMNGLHKYGIAGVNALAQATPIDSGETAMSWDYSIEKTDSGYRIVWTNSNVNDGQVVAILLQYGHGTGTGGYVQGLDYINPAMQNIFVQLAEDAWREVKG